jgi:hypothetical protein
MRNGLENPAYIFHTLKYTKNQPEFQSPRTCIETCRCCGYNGAGLS